MGEGEGRSPPFLRISDPGFRIPDPGSESEIAESPISKSKIRNQQSRTTIKITNQTSQIAVAFTVTATDPLIAFEIGHPFSASVASA